MWPRAKPWHWEWAGGNLRILGCWPTELRPLKAHCQPAGNMHCSCFPQGRLWGRKRRNLLCEGFGKWGQSLYVCSLMDTKSAGLKISKLHVMKAARPGINKRVSSALGFHSSQTEGQSGAFWGLEAVSPVAVISYSDMTFVNSPCSSLVRIRLFLHLVLLRVCFKTSLPWWPETFV